MNKKLICLLMFVFSLGLAFTACSDDDNSNADLIAGTYSGDLEISGLTATPISNNIILSKVNDNAVKMSIVELDIPDIGKVKGINVKSVIVAKSGNTYTLISATEDIEVTLVTSLGEVKKTAKVQVLGGTVTSGAMDDLSILVTNIQDLEGLTLAITFSGEK